MQVTLKMWTPKGTMVEVTLDTADGNWDGHITNNDILHLESMMLQDGFTSQRPDHTYPVKEGIAEGIVVTDGNHWQTKEPQKVLNVYCKGTNLNFRDFTVFPESPVYPVIAAMVDLNNSVDQAPGRDKMQRYQKAWQPVDFRYTAKPAKYADGSLVYRKKQDGTQKDYPEYEIVAVNGVAQGFTNGNAPSPATNGNGAQRTQQAGATPDATWTWVDLKAWSMSIGAFNHEKHATNRFFQLVEELFDVQKEHVSEFLKACTEDKLTYLREAFIDDAYQRAGLERFTSVDEMADEEIPF